MRSMLYVRIGALHLRMAPCTNTPSFARGTHGNLIAVLVKAIVKTSARLA